MVVKDVDDHMVDFKIDIINCVGLMEYSHLNLYLLPTYIVEHLPLH